MHCPILSKRKNSEKIVKKFLLAAAFTSVFAVGAIAQTSNQSIPRDPPFGKGNADNDTMHLPGSAAIAQTSNQSIPPRDPPFGKGNAGNDTMLGVGQTTSPVTRDPDAAAMEPFDPILAPL